jgi:hypothetical protein
VFASAGGVEALRTCSSAWRVGVARARAGWPLVVAWTRMDSHSVASLFCGCARPMCKAQQLHSCVGCWDDLDASVYCCGWACAAWLGEVARVLCDEAWRVTRPVWPVNVAELAELLIVRWFGPLIAVNNVEDLRGREYNENFLGGGGEGKSTAGCSAWPRLRLHCRVLQGWGHRQDEKCRDWTVIAFRQMRRPFSMPAWR